MAAAAGKTTKKPAEPVRVDVLHGTYSGQATRTVHVPVPVSIDGCHTFTYHEREGRFGNALPEGATAAEKAAFKLMTELKYVQGVDEIRPDGHAIEIRFGRTFDADAIMPQVLKLIFKHLGFTAVLLSFWAEKVVGQEWARIPAPYTLRVPRCTIKPLPETKPAVPAAGIGLTLECGQDTLVVDVAGGDLAKLVEALGQTHRPDPILVTGIQRHGRLN
jgi:hypothetical protein